MENLKIRYVAAKALCHTKNSRHRFSAKRNYLPMKSPLFHSTVSYFELKVAASTAALSLFDYCKFFRYFNDRSPVVRAKIDRAPVPPEKPETVANCVRNYRATVKHPVSYRRAPSFFLSAGAREPRGKGRRERPGPGLGEGRDGRRTGTLAGVAATASRIDARPGPGCESQLESYADENGQGKSRSLVTARYASPSVGASRDVNLTGLRRENEWNSGVASHLSCVIPKTSNLAN